MLQRLADLEDERNSLKMVMMDAENMRKVRFNAVFLPTLRYLRINLKLSEQSNLGMAKHSSLDKVTF